MIVREKKSEKKNKIKHWQFQLFRLCNTTEKKNPRPFAFLLACSSVNCSLWFSILMHLLVDYSRNGLVVADIAERGPIDHCCIKVAF